MILLFLALLWFITGIFFGFGFQLGVALANKAMSHNAKCTKDGKKHG